VEQRLAGRRRPAQVVQTGPDAVYLEVDGDCVGVLGARAVQVPCGVRTRWPSLPPVGYGEVGVVGGGSIGTAAWGVRVASVVDVTVPSVPEDAVPWAANRLGARSSELPAAALRGLAAGDPSGVPALLGLGPGLTPLGDDVLCGWLAGAAAVRARALGAVSDEVTRLAPSRTTLLSAALLACAVRGEAVPQAAAVLAAVARRDEARLARSLAALLEVGSSTGAGLALGLSLGLSVGVTRAQVAA